MLVSGPTIASPSAADDSVLTHFLCSLYPHSQQACSMVMWEIMEPTLPLPLPQTHQQPPQPPALTRMRMRMRMKKQVFLKFYVCCCLSTLQNYFRHTHYFSTLFFRYLSARLSSHCTLLPANKLIRFVFPPVAHHSPP